MEQLLLFPLDVGPANQASNSSEVDVALWCPNAANSPTIACSERDRARRLDQFYTRDEVADELHGWFSNQCAAHNLCKSAPPQFMEPSAGTGSFLRLLPPGSIAFDIDPKALGIIQADFLEMRLEARANLIVIGNPPFGKNANMAIRFFNHAASAATVIAFIVPLTFQKLSVQNRLDLRFHLLDELPVPKGSFIFEGKRKDVPAVFQIWVKRSEQRQRIYPCTTHPDFQFLTGADAHKANFAIQRVGANAGRIHHNLQAKPSAHYFIKASPGIDDLEAIMGKLDFKTAAMRTSGNPSLAKTELVHLYTQMRKDTSSA